MRRDLNPGIKEGPCYGVGLFWPEPEFPLFFYFLQHLTKLLRCVKKKQICAESLNRSQKDFKRPEQKTTNTGPAPQHLPYPK